MNFVEELRWRSMLHDIMPGTEDKFNEGITSGYIGFDPTADSLHVGHLTQIMTLVHFQKAGHKPYVLVGGATGMVGDPSGKSQERNLLNDDTLTYNVNCIKSQLEKFLDFDNGANKAELVNNYDWFKNFNVLDFIREVGKHITVNYMMAKDSVKRRIDGEGNGLSFTEFTYQLIQGYDFYYLWKHNNCIVQMGGSDQWGNITTGTELIRRMDGGTAFALTTQLIRKADGQKFGKTESGAIWLDPAKTSPYKFYQFWLNATDDDAKNWIRIFTLTRQQEIESLEEEHNNAPHLRILQKALAKDITIRVHGEKEYETAVSSSEFLFGNGSIELLNSMSDDNILNIFDGVEHFNITATELENGINIVDLMGDRTKIFPSKSEAKKMIQGGGLSINKAKVSDINTQIDNSNVINSKFIIAQRGKKNYYLIIIKD